MKQFTDLDPEIIAARAKVEAAVERFRAYATGPQPDRETMIQMQSAMINSCPSWIPVTKMEPTERARILSYLKKHNEGITSTPNPRTAWTDGT